MSTQHAYYVLLFLVLAVNSDRFQLHTLTLAVRSYALLLEVVAQLPVSEGDGLVQ